jgi:GTP cyclohydrolase I
MGLIRRLLSQRTKLDEPSRRKALGYLEVSKIALAVRQILNTVGFDPYTNQNLIRTPDRVAQAFEEYTRGYWMNLNEVLKTSFPSDGYGTYDEMIVQKDIPFYSLCEHHLVPFSGVAHVGYIPGRKGRIVGLSKMARVVDVFAKRFQVQERLTMQIADALTQHLKPRGVGVMIEAVHLCICMRGVKKPGTSTVTSCLRGAFRKQSTRAEFFNLIRR